MSTLPLPASPDFPLYRRVADRIAGLIGSGTFGPGDRIPSVRRMSRQLTVSQATIVEAYRLLEDRGLVEARPQSGFYVRPSAAPTPRLRRTASGRSATKLDIGDLTLRYLRECGRADLVPLGAAVPDSSFLPVAKLNRVLARVVRLRAGTSAAYDPLPGHAKLRAQVARRALEAGCVLEPEEIVTTSGAQQALGLCLRAVTRPGDTVAIESPTYYGLLEVLGALHLRALEVATDPHDGICLEALAEALDRQSVAAVALVPSFGNPLGHCMPDDARRRLVELLAARGVPLVEDDVYGELPFEGSRPKACQAFDRQGLVLLCSSFSKTIAPGFRVGWAAPGRFRDAVERLKFATSVAAPTPTQMAVAEFLADGGFDRHVRRMRRTYRDLVCRISCAVAEAFPAGTRISRPAGGHVLWIELPPGTDSVRLHDQALHEGIGVLPGPLFSAAGRYRNFIRLNCAVPWTPPVADAIRTLGRLAAARG
jgi:DNA-binding transcriptional MocR family regulator